jgi:hypothetical protein
MICSHSGSRIPDLGSPISDPGSRILGLGSWVSDLGSRFSDPTTTKKRRKFFVVVLPAFVIMNFTKFKIILFLNRYREKVEAINKEIKVFFTQKVASKLQEIWVVYPGPEIWEPGSGKNFIRIRNTAYLYLNSCGTEYGR